MLQFNVGIRWRPSGIEKFLNGEADVAGNLAQESRRDISARMNRHGGYATIRVPELLVRAALAKLAKTEALQQCHHLARLEDWWLRH